MNRAMIVAVVAALASGFARGEAGSVPTAAGNAPLANVLRTPDPTEDVAARIYRDVSPSLVAVEYTWESELGRRELVGAGVVISEDGLVLTTLALLNPRIPDEQMKDFKILVPGDEKDVEELDATVLGRDERADVAFIKVKDAKRKWKPVKFVETPLKVGQEIWSVGMLPKIAGYKPYIMEGRVSALLRGDMPQVLVSGRLAAVGAPVFDAGGQAVGFVMAQDPQPILLNDPKASLATVSVPPVVFIASSGFSKSIADPPAGDPLKLPWIGVVEMQGLKKEVTEYFGLGDQTAVQIGDVVPGGPAEKAGLKPGAIILKLNGKPIERGDLPEELPMILRRQLLQLKSGDRVVLSVMDPKTKKTEDIPMTLEERPKQPNVAKRFYAEDLGFTGREMVFGDAYSRYLDARTAKGVVVALVRPQSSAQTARLDMNDLIVELNGQPVTSLEQFQKDYEAFRKERPREAVVLVVLREGKNQTIRIEPPQ